MKNLFYLLILICTVNSAYSQKLAGNIYTTTVKNGAGQKSELRFQISEETLQKFKLSKEYSSCKSDTGYIRKQLDPITKDTIAICLMSRVNMATLMVRFELKNEASMQFIPDSEGIIYFTDDIICISFPFKAQNGYGNMVFMTGILKGVKAFVY